MSTIKDLALCSYFYSSASWRVRSVLALKKIPYKYEAVNLLDGKQHSEDFLNQINPMHQVPALRVTLKDGSEHILTQSSAIIQFLEDNYPNDSVFPADPILRYKSLAIADTIGGGIQPLQNLETLVNYTEPLGLPALDQEARKTVARYWIDRKLVDLERLVKQTAGKYCVGDSVTIADFFLVPQMFNCKRFGMDASKYPLLNEINDRLSELDFIKAGHPLVCPDAPKTS